MAGSPLYRGQGNQPFETARPVSAAKRGQNVPYDINGAPQGPIAGALADGDYGDVVVSGTGTVFTLDPTVVTAFARTILDDASAAAVRTTLGLVTIASSGSASDLTTGTVAAARMPAFTGDATTVAGAVALTLATVNSTTGTFGGATTSAQITVNGKGLITNVSAVTITPAFSSITGTPTTLAGYGITLTSANVTTALGYTPTSVTGLTGVNTVAAFKTGLSLVKADVGLGSVDNTADAAKAVLSATKWTTARLLAGNSTDGSANVPFANKFIVQGTTDTGLSGAQFLGALGTGIVKNTTTTGVLSIAVAADFPTLNQSTTGSAASLTTGRTITMTGDVAWTSPAFDGSGNVTAAGTLATVNSNVGSFGSATQVATFTVNAKGLTTAAANVTITPAVGSITGLGTGIATFLATPSSANLLAAMTDKTGTGLQVFGTSPTLTTPAINGPLNVTGGTVMTGSWVRTALFSAAFPVVGLESNFSGTSNFMGVGYDRTAGPKLVLYLNASTNDITAGTLVLSITPTMLSAITGIVSTSNSGGIGYATGAGGTVTQLTSKTTGVTLSRPCGQIVSHNAALAAAALVSFTVTNTTVAATDTITLNLASGNVTAGTYRYWIDKVSAGSFVIAIENRSAGSLSEALTFNFAIEKAVTS